jgi:hypothetical protein
LVSWATTGTLAGLMIASAAIAMPTANAHQKRRSFFMFKRLYYNKGMLRA